MGFNAKKRLEINLVVICSLCEGGGVLNHLGTHQEHPLLPVRAGVDQGLVLLRQFTAAVAEIL